MFDGNKKILWKQIEYCTVYIFKEKGNFLVNVIKNNSMFILLDNIWLLKSNNIFSVLVTLNS